MTAPIELIRTTRFCVNDPGFGELEAQVRADPNGCGGRPSMRGLGRSYSVDVSARGLPNPVLGYLIDIKAIDRAVRDAVVPLIARACHEEPARDPATLMPTLLDALCGLLPVRPASLRWNLTPSLSITMTTQDTTTVVLRSTFEFAAAHRLHVDTLSAEENRRLFGKCNNPNGHGHNYRVEPAVALALPPGGAPGFTVQDLERLVEASIIEPFDHMNLNTDVPEFAQDGVNPSVEHIARVCHERLARAIAEDGAPARLLEVTVWETDRTRCTYPAS